jgi:tRNA(fMet)-specific endonuclease VapC
VLDTDHLSLLEWSTSEDAQRLEQRLDRVPLTEVVTTIVCYEEQVRGWLSRLTQARTLDQQVEAYRRLNRQLDNYRELTVLDFDHAAAREFDRLSKLRLRVGTKDLKIAAIVLAHNATLLSRNLGDFRRVPGLRVEDWTAP